ncbi:iron-containing alcohol dehydrogenase [Pseudodesulfovibrio sp. zrk46]|uniref:iron-containing alcohol dehydrogenase n=1 Tax=Pseudodesulfovibrio sp. zrk46 TaxID=2725288 RepID=UPI001449F45C|nr:iron-containing alcohol dehydrogenase [Pseudodesulfovibrio sp. zrk46]QJB57136.1 iron-containing alcohol dehydrogenase [Pseudodesulfovibrio sp. zrk46]
MQFNFATAAKIVFKNGVATEVPTMAANLGSKPCLVIGSNADRAQWLINELDAPHVVQVTGEPDTDFAAQASQQAREAGCDVVIGMGGGSVMDAAKVIAALITNTADIFDYLEVVGKGQPLTEKPMPLITVPTTAGTGSEVTANGVLLAKGHDVKVSLRSTDMIADIAVIDPELMISMPPNVTAATGMDALTQLMEAYVSHAANPMTDGLCREGMMRAATSLPIAFEDGRDIMAREDMAMAALFSGIALANAKLGAVHGFAAPLGGQFKVPHGEVCATLLPHVMRANIAALRERDPESPSLFRYNEIAVMLTGDVTCGPEDGADWVEQLCEELVIPRLSDMGVTADHFEELVEMAANASSMKGNPIELTKEELMAILEAAS